MRKQHFLKVLKAIFRSELKKGHLKWKTTDIARLSGVPRSSIYYSLGKTKLEIFKTCFERLIKQLYGLDMDYEGPEFKTKLYQCIYENFVFFKDLPEFFLLYNQHSIRKTPMQSLIKSHETQYLRKLSHLFPHLEAAEKKAFQAILYGLVSSPFLDPETFGTAIRKAVTPFLKPKLN